MEPLIIRQAEEKDFDAILRLNSDDVRYTSEMDTQLLKKLYLQSEMTLVCSADGETAGFIIALTAGADYSSVNYRWFSGHYENFIYIDRVVVGERFRRRGIAAGFYRRVFRYAKSAGIQCVCAEINIIPPNYASLAFHDSFGFKEQDTLEEDQGKKTVSLRTADII